MIRRASLALLVVLASCSLVTDTDGLTRDPTSNAPSGLDGGTTPDAADASGSPGDGGTSSVDGAKPATCTGMAVFCDDFESGSLLPQWADTGLFESAAGTIAIDPAVGVSGAGLRSRLRSGNGPCQNAFVEKAFRGSFSKISGTVMVRHEIDTLATVITLGIGGDEDRCEALLNTDSEKLALYVQNYIGGNTGQTNYQNFSVPFPRGTWVTLSFDADFAGGTITLGVNGQTTTASLLGCPLEPANAFVALGMTCEKAATADRVIQFDDLASRVGP